MQSVAAQQEGDKDKKAALKFFLIFQYQRVFRRLRTSAAHTHINSSKTYEYYNEL